LDNLESVKSIRRQRTVFVSGVFSGNLEKWHSDNGKILDVSAKEIAEPNKRSDDFDVCRRLCISNSMELVSARLDTFWSQHETKV
jgi:hypothetical protein